MVRMRPESNSWWPYFIRPILPTEIENELHQKWENVTSTNRILEQSSGDLQPAERIALAYVAREINKCTIDYFCANLQRPEISLGHLHVVSKCWWLSFAFHHIP